MAAVYPSTTMATFKDGRPAMLKTRFSNLILKAKQNKLFDHDIVTRFTKIHKETSRKRSCGRAGHGVEAKTITSTSRKRSCGGAGHGVEAKTITSTSRKRPCGGAGHRVEAKTITSTSRKRPCREEEGRGVEADQLKRQRQLREKERTAARIKLEKMEKTVDLEQNMQSFKELQTLAGCTLCFVLDRNTKEEEPKVVMGAYQGIRFWNPLEKIGLRIKEEDQTAERWIINPNEDEIEEGEIVSQTVQIF